MNVCNWDWRYFLSTPPPLLLLPQSDKCDGRESTRLGAYRGSLRSSLHWWIARRLKANVNLVNTANTQKIPLSTQPVCRPEYGMVSPVSANALLADDLPSGFSPGEHRGYPQTAPSWLICRQLVCMWPTVDIWNTADIITGRAGGLY